MAQNTSQTDGGRYRLSSGEAWSVERWAAVVVLVCLGFLLLIRMGFRGVNVLGARVSV